jgi:hypothetical protein
VLTCRNEAFTCKYDGVTCTSPFFVSTLHNVNGGVFVKNPVISRFFKKEGNGHMNHCQLNDDSLAEMLALLAQIHSLLALMDGLLAKTGLLLAEIRRLLALNII